MQWNCKGLRTRSDDLKVLLNELNPGIVCLQETKLGNSPYNPGLDYVIHKMNPRGDHAHGGVAIIVNKSVQHSHIILNTQLQAIAVRACLDREITICSLYLPPRHRVTMNEMQVLVNQLPPPLLLLGDFNSHNPLWGGVVLDAEGRTIDDFIHNNNLLLFNDGSMTFHNIYSNSFSAIDLSICSPEIYLDFIWSINEDLHGSDHYPIHLKFVRNAPSDGPIKWKESEADWVTYEGSFNILQDLESFASHIHCYDNFMEKILDNAETSIPKTKGKPRRPPVPWWNKTCGNLRKITRKCYRRYKNNASPATKLIYQRAKAKQRKYFRKVKKESWLFYINGINSKTPSRLIWRKIRKLSGKFVPSPSPTIKINDVLISDPEEVAERFANHFSEISSSRNYSPHFQNIRNSEVSLTFESQSAKVYNAKFSLRELKEALSTCDSTSPGADNITYGMLKYLPEHAKLYLLKILNKIWETGILPPSWKISIVVPIKKPHKDPHQPTSYRPISLTSCVCKLFEKMVNARLMWHLEENGLLSNVQFGFRRNRSSVDPLLRLSTQIQHGFSNRCQTVGVFFDLEKAYDTTWRFGIVKRLHEMGISGNMLSFVNSFLSDRYIRVRVGNTLSSSYELEEGVPQGSVLSVTCFAVATDSIVESVSAPLKALLFVDDFAIYVTTYDAVSACNYLQKSINAISKWADEHGFRFSSSKTVAVRFTRSTRNEIIPNLKLRDTLIPFEKEVKFLGMIFDNKLTWSSHIDSLKIKVKKSLDILRVVSGFSWGAPKESLLRLYDSICRSKIEYGCQIYSSACATKLKELDVVHNTGLRICSGAFKTSPVESLYVDTEELPLDLRREELGLRYMLKLKGSPDNPASNVIKQCDPRKFDGPRSSKPFPVRLNATVEEVNIKNQSIKEISSLKTPPWLTPEPSVCKKFVVKKSTSVQAVKMKFLEHDQLHSNSVKLYTDGSKSPEGVGCAVIYGDRSYVGRLCNNASVFTAELTAVSKSLEIVSTLQGRNFTIYCDSYSVLMAIKQYNPKHPIVQKIQEWLWRLSSKFKKVNFCWVPAHVGIPGNELADKEAKEAILRNDLNFYHVPVSDMKGVIRSYVKKKWQTRWSSHLLANNKKYKKIRQSVDHWPSSFHSNRKIEVVLSRLRIGHTHFTHSFLLEGGAAPVCALCDLPLSVEHVLVQCTQYNAVRQRHELGGKSLEELLGPNVDVYKLVGFLKDKNILNKV